MTIKGGSEILHLATVFSECVNRLPDC